MRTRTFDMGIASNEFDRQRIYVDRIVRREEGGYENPRSKCMTYVCSERAVKKQVHLSANETARTMNSYERSLINFEIIVGVVCMQADTTESKDLNIYNRRLISADLK